MRIETERLVLRPWQAGDEEALVRHANNRKVWLNLRDRFPHPYTWNDAMDWLARRAEAMDVVGAQAFAKGAEHVSAPFYVLGRPSRSRSGRNAARLPFSLRCMLLDVTALAAPCPGVARWSPAGR